MTKQLLTALYFHFNRKVHINRMFDVLMSDEDISLSFLFQRKQKTFIYLTEVGKNFLEKSFMSILTDELLEISDKIGLINTMVKDHLMQQLNDEYWVNYYLKAFKPSIAQLVLNEPLRIPHPSDTRKGNRTKRSTPHKEATKEKMRKPKKYTHNYSKPKSEEHKNKIREAMKNIENRTELNKRISEGMKAYRQSKKK